MQSLLGHWQARHLRLLWARCTRLDNCANHARLVTRAKRSILGTLIFETLDQASRVRFVQVWKRGTETANAPVMIVNFLSDLPGECHQRRRLLERNHELLGRLLGGLARHDEREFLVDSVGSG